MTSSDYEGTVVVHYNREEIQKEIARFSRDRWIAVHCELLNKKGRQYILRKQASGEKQDTTRHQRTWECANASGTLHGAETENILCPRKCLRLNSLSRARQKNGNIRLCLPMWDIDNTIEKQ